MKKVLLACLITGLLCVALVGVCRAQCVYTERKYSSIGRLLKCNVVRLDELVGEVVYSRNFDGYFVKCKKGGISGQQFFSRARDARWKACDRCY